MQRIQTTQVAQHKMQTLIQHAQAIVLTHKQATAHNSTAQLQQAKHFAKLLANKLHNNAILHMRTVYAKHSTTIVQFVLNNSTNMQQALQLLQLQLKACKIKNCTVKTANNAITVTLANKMQQTLLATVQNANSKTRNAAQLAQQAKHALQQHTAQLSKLHLQVRMQTQQHAIVLHFAQNLQTSSSVNMRKVYAFVANVAQLINCKHATITQTAHSITLQAHC